MVELLFGVDHLNYCFNKSSFLKSNLLHMYEAGCCFHFKQPCHLPQLHIPSLVPFQMITFDALSGKVNLRITHINTITVY